LIESRAPSATAMATPITASKPSLLRDEPDVGQGKDHQRREDAADDDEWPATPAQNQTRSLITPINNWPMMPASGPAAHHDPDLVDVELYSVARIQLSTEICNRQGEPMAVAGSVSRTRKGVDSLRCMPSIVCFPRGQRCEAAVCSTTAGV